MFHFQTFSFLVHNIVIIKWDRINVGGGLPTGTQKGVIIDTVNQPNVK